MLMMMSWPFSESFEKKVFGNFQKVFMKKKSGIFRTFFKKDFRNFQTEFYEFSESFKKF